MPLSIVAPRKDLLRTLDATAPIADRKSPVPMLADVLLTADGRTLRIAATDLYLGMSGDVDCETASAGSVALPAKDFLDRVKAMPDGPVQIVEADGCKVTVKAVGQARRYLLHGLPGADFPILPKPSGDAIELPCDLLALLVARTHFSISTDETRAHVNSALFALDDNGLRMVSTDGHRLSLMQAKYDARPFHMLIPLKAILDLKKIVEANKGKPLLMHQAGPYAFFTVAGLTFSVKLVDAQFPPYDQVIPKSPGRSAAVSRLAFIDALKAVHVAAPSATNGVKLTFATGVLHVSTESPETGNASDEISIDYAGPGETSVGFNAKYLLDALGAMDAEEVTASFDGELDPIALRPRAEPESTSYVAVCMPLRL